MGLVVVWAGVRVMTRYGMDREVTVARAGDGAEFSLTSRDFAFFSFFHLSFHLSTCTIASSEHSTAIENFPCSSSFHR